MKLNLFMCFYFIFIFETPWTIFDSALPFFLLFGLDTYKHA